MSQQSPRLADLVRSQGPLPPDTVASLLLPVAESLASLHALSGVHGAVSPSAVLVAEGTEGGYATLLESPGVAADPSFTAPEVAAGQRADDRADVWSFAGVLFHAATGQSPYSPPAGPRDGGWLRPVIELSLLPDPRERPTMADVAAYLRARVRPEQSSPSGRRSVSGLVMALGGLASIVLLAAVGAALLLGGDGSGDRAAHDTERVPTPATSAPPPTPPPSATPSRPPRERPTEAELEAFARRYVATASTDPDRGFSRLTPDYRRESPRYHEVWTAIEDPEILSLDADPRTMSVSYHYRYRLPGGVQRSERVTLRLVERGDRLLIAGATARPL